MKTRTWLVLRRLLSVAALAFVIFSLAGTVNAMAATTTNGSCTATNVGTNTSVTDGGVASCVNSIRTGMFVPILIAITGLAFTGSTVGMMFRPDKRELLTHVSAISLTGLIAVGGAAGIMAAMNAMNSSNATGALIH